MKLLKLYLTYLRIKRRGWPKFKNFREYRKRRKWLLTKPDFSKTDWKHEYTYETPNTPTKIQ